MPTKEQDIANLRASLASWLSVAPGSVSDWLDRVNALRASLASLIE